MQVLNGFYEVVTKNISALYRILRKRNQFFLLIIATVFSNSGIAQEPEIVWSSNVRHPPFATPDATCQFGVPFVASPSLFNIVYTGLRQVNDYYVCDCTLTRLTTGVTTSFGSCAAAYPLAVTYKLVDSSDSPPPNHCDLNPVEVSTGVKIQHEPDLTAKGEGHVEFARFYNNTNPAKVWHHSYQQSLGIIDATLPERIRHTSTYFSTKASACVSGFNSIKSQISGSWAANATATLDGDACQIKQGNVITRNLMVMKNVFMDKNIASSSIQAIQLTRTNGSIITYQQKNGVWLPINGSKGVLENIDLGDSKWRFILNGVTEEYSNTGKLLVITAKNGVKQHLTYDETSGLLRQVQDTKGKKLQFGYTDNRLSSIIAEGNEVTEYVYNSAGLITEVKRPDNTRRLYHYEDLRFPTALTGITDERNVRFSTWTYDAEGRAITSQHANGAELGAITFNVDGSTTVTGYLNKQTVYRFADIAGARRVVKVEGQPTTNCAGANQDYTYTPEGWVASKTDWKGIKTTFTYNTQGQELTRTEAFGTANARTTMTEWHPTLGLKTKVTEQNKETTFIYDAKGLLLNQNTRSLP